MKIESITEGEYKAFHINSIKRSGHPLRSKGKTSTFALQYAGTFFTLMKNSGFSEPEAREIEARFRTLYAASDAYTAARIDEAATTGHVTGAFGLKLRTPLVQRSHAGKDTAPRELAAERRTVGNMLFQSTGLLTNRSMNAFMARVHASDFALDILPVAMIHDASYFLVRDDPEVVHYLNTWLIHEMRWTAGLPEIQHDIVTVGAELDIFHPTWADPITIPNYLSPDAIVATCAQAMQARTDAALEAAAAPTPIQET